MNHSSSVVDALAASAATPAKPGLGNTTKFTDELWLPVDQKDEQKQGLITLVNTSTGQIRTLAADQSDRWREQYDEDAALLERWMMQRYAQRLLSRPGQWIDREKVQPAPYTDLTAKVHYCEIDTRREVKRLAHSMGQPVVRSKHHALVSGELYTDLSSGDVRSTESTNIAPKFRVVTCFRRKVPGAQPELWRNPDSGAVAFHNVAVCGSVWTCPICSAKINRRRRDEIARAYDAVGAVDGASYMLTFTIKHGRGDDLADLLCRMKSAMQELQKSTEFKQVTRSVPLKRPRAGSLDHLGYIGRIANLEVTHGERNGWHPHEHHLWFFRRELTSDEITWIRDKLFDAWAKACVNAGLEPPVKTYRKGSSVRYLGLDIRRALSAQEYLTKYGAFTPDGEAKTRRWGPEKELAGSHVKAARKKGSTPFQLLYDYGQGKASAGEKFLQFADAFRGRHQLQFSRSLKAFLLEQEALVIDDSEEGNQELAATLEGEAELLTQLTDHQFDKIVRNRAHSMVLIIARRHGREAALGFIAGLDPNPPPS